jgi:hypothetical protein
MDDNKYRNHFSHCIRDHYNESDIFDIALAEATYSDGSLNLYRGGEAGLVNEYTYDGGHLNETGSQRLAYVLIKKLLELENTE